MTELTVPSLPAKSDARQLSTLSTPLLFSHRLCDHRIILKFILIRSNTMTELTVPSLPAKSDARQLSTLSTPLLFSHRLCDQEKCQEALTEQRLMELTFVTLTLCRCGEAEVEKDSGCNDRLSFYLACFEKCQEALTEQRLMELTFVTLTLCRCGEAEVEKDSGCNDRLSFYLACFESAPQPGLQRPAFLLPCLL